MPRHPKDASSPGCRRVEADKDWIRGSVNWRADCFLVPMTSNAFCWAKIVTRRAVNDGEVPRYLCPMQDSISSHLHLTWQDTALFAETPQAELSEQPIQSLFEGHLLPVREDKMLPVAVSDGAGWVFLVLMACTVLFAFAQRVGEIRPSILLRAAFDRATANRLLRYASGSDGVMSSFLSLAGAVSIGVFITAALSSYTQFMHGHFVDFLLVTGFVVLSGIANRALHISLGVLFQVGHLVRANAQDRTTLTVTCGVLLLPISALFHFGPSSYSDTALMLGVFMMAALYLKEVQRSITLLWGDAAVTAAHIFYYFCAFKIMPLCVLVRLLTV